MYLIAKINGKQYKISKGKTIEIERIHLNIGSNFIINNVLAIKNNKSMKIGEPLINGITVLTTVISHGRNKKISIFKMKRRKHYKKTLGWRRNYTKLYVKSINLNK